MNPPGRTKQSFFLVLPVFGHLKGSASEGPWPEGAGMEARALSLLLITMFSYLYSRAAIQFKFRKWAAGLLLVFYFLADVLKEDIHDLCSLDFINLFILNSKFHCCLVALKKL